MISCLPYFTGDWFHMTLYKCLLSADSNTQVGGVMIIHDQPQVWSIESTCFHSPNVVITGKCTLLIGE